MTREREALRQLGLRIRRLRRSKGLSLIILSDRVEIGVGTLCDIENGKRDPKYSTLEAIARGLGLNIAGLTAQDRRAHG